MTKRLSPRHLRVALCAMLLVLVASLVLAPAGAATSAAVSTTSSAQSAMRRPRERAWILAITPPGGWMLKDMG